MDIAKTINMSLYRNISINIFSHPDFTVGFGISPNHATFVARGL